MSTLFGNSYQTRLLFRRIQSRELNEQAARRAMLNQTSQVAIEEKLAQPPPMSRGEYLKLERKVLTSLINMHSNRFLSEGQLNGAGESRSTEMEPT